MIDIKELRIGNYVRPQNTTGAKSVNGIVFSIDDYRVSVEGNKNQYDYHLLTPIPLSRDILLNSGFWQAEDYDCYSINIFDKFGLGIKYNSNVVIFYVTDVASNGILELPTSHKLEYVHQLQNLYFALTGKELEVKL